MAKSGGNQDRNVETEQRATTDGGATKRKPVVGDVVEIGVQAGLVCRVHAPDMVDAVVYGAGVPTVVERVLYDPTGSNDGWSWPGEVTPAMREALAKRIDPIAVALAAGRRVPKVGETVTYVADQESCNPIFRRLEAHRAIVTSVVDADRVQLEVYDEVAPPPFPEPDRRRGIWGQGPSTSVPHGTAKPNYKPGTWFFTDELAPGTVFEVERRDDLPSEQVKCPKCSRMCRRPLPSIEINNRWHYGCQSCLADLAEQIICPKGERTVSTAAG